MIEVLKALYQALHEYRVALDEAIAKNGTGAAGGAGERIREQVERLARLTHKAFAELLAEKELEK